MGNLRPRLPSPPTRERPPVFPLRLLPSFLVGLLSCPCASAPSPSSLNSFPDLHISALSARILGRRGQPLTPIAEDTWLSPASSPSLGLSFPRSRVGSKPEGVGDAGACAQAFAFLWGKTARALSLLKAAGHPGPRFCSLRYQSARSRPSGWEDDQVQCSGSRLYECWAPPGPSFPQCKAGLKASQPELGETADR